MNEKSRFEIQKHTIILRIMEWNEPVRISFTKVSSKSGDTSIYTVFFATQYGIIEATYFEKPGEEYSKFTMGDLESDHPNPLLDKLQKIIAKHRAETYTEESKMNYQDK